MIIDEWGEKFKSKAYERGHFVVSLDKSYGLYKADEEGILEIRDLLRKNVLIPLVEISSQVVVYGAECLQHDFQHAERKGLDRLIVKKAASYEIDLTNRDKVVVDYPDFWAGVMFDASNKKYYHAGYKLFLLDPAHVDFGKLFSCFSKLYVVTNLGSLGRSFINRARKYAEKNPDKMAVAFFDGTKFVFFPGNDVMARILTEAIDFVRRE
jgi:hypothetical protein